MRVGRVVSAGSQPKRLGAVTVFFAEPTSIDSSPALDEKTSTITVPVFEESRIAELPDNRFLFFVRNAHMGKADDLWFGGTDEEHPFLARLTPDLWRAYLLGGAAAFFRAIVPCVIRRVAKGLRQPILRQGDLYAVRIWDSWEEFHAFARLTDILFDAGEQPLREVKDEEIFQTRHCLTGRMADEDFFPAWGEDTGFIFAEGVLTAPDHRPLRLSGVHVVQQMDCLLADED